MAEEQTVIVETSAAGGRKKWVLFGIGGLVLVVLCAIGVIAFLVPGSTPDEAGEPVAAAEGSGPPIYQSLHPPLVVNFRDQSGDAHYMQITMEVMSREQSVINAVREHTPAIRNALILLYGGAVYENVETRAGKEKMLADGRDEIERIVAEASGERGVEAVYFTDLVIQ